MRKKLLSSLPKIFQRFLLEWSAVLLVLMGFVWYANSTQVALLANNHVYDYILNLKPHPSDEQVIVIGIDDASLADLGRWPWSRTVHADLLNRLNEYEPRAVLIDILFTEPSSVSSDLALKESIDRLSQNALVAAPILLSSYAGEPAKVALPVEAVAHAAKLGQIVVIPDNDGVVRHAYLGLLDGNGRMWPTLSALLLDNERWTDILEHYPKKFRIPYSAKGNYRTFPYSSVLRGEVDPEFLRDKYVLIGPTAVGLGDQLTTPVSGSEGTVAGIEIHANILDALLNRNLISEIDSDWQWLVALLPLLVLMLLFLRVNERHYLLLFIVSLFIYLAFATYLLWFESFWLSPVITILAMLMAYLLWGWRRAVAILRDVKEELDTAQRSTGTLFKLMTRYQSDHRFLPNTLELEVQKIRQLYQFTGEGLANLPTALIVVGVDGEILLVNHNAQKKFKVTEYNLMGLLKRIDPNIQLGTEDAKGVWLENLQGIELNGLMNEVYELQVTSIVFNNISSPDDWRTNNAVWLINILDLTNERAAEQQRSELIGFLSHDLRTPQVSILSLLELQKNSETKVDETTFYERIEEKVHHTLDWAHDLVQLSQAKTQTYRYDECGFAHLIDEATIQVCELATAKEITLVFSNGSRLFAEQIWLTVDGALIVRALVNLLSNAVRYSPSNTEVRIEVASHMGAVEANDLTVTDDVQKEWVVCHIIDQGLGMDAEQLKHLQMGKTPIQAQHDPDVAKSLGVGFIMARTVILRHGGRLVIHSEKDKGTTISLYFPL